MVTKSEQDDHETPTSSGPAVGAGDNRGAGVRPVTGATAASGVTGHDAEESDPLPSDHRLIEADAKAVRAESRKDRTSPGNAQGVNHTREQMYREPDNNAGGESGTQGGATGREGQNPVGRHK